MDDKKYVYLTNYIFTIGIIKAEIKSKLFNNSWIASFYGEWLNKIGHMQSKPIDMHDKNVHSTLESAKNYALKLKLKRIESLEKQLKKMKAFNVENIEIFGQKGEKNER